MLLDQRQEEKRKSWAHRGRRQGTGHKPGEAYVYPSGAHSVALLGGLGTWETPTGGNLGCGTGVGKQDFTHPHPPRVGNGTNQPIGALPPGVKTSRTRSRD